MKSINKILSCLEDTEAMRSASQRALRLTMELNSRYHTPEEVRKRFFALICQPEDDTFCLFPPFYTDYGQNITVGRNVFINTGCRFQDQGGIFLGDGALIGHHVVLATLNHDEDPARRHVLHPAPIVLGGTSFVTTAPAATMAPSPMATPGTTVALAPIQTFLPRTMGAGFRM